MATGTDTAVTIEKGDPSELQFQDIAHSESIDSFSTDDSRPGKKKKVQTHTFTNFPDDGQSDDDDTDRADLLSGEKKQLSFWTFEYYQQFFDVDSKQVFHRILGSMLPNPRGTNYLQHHIRPRPDLYGPFWICSTLVFTTAIAGNLANYLQHAGSYEWHYDFHKVTFAACAIFSYWWVIPTLIWLLLWWRGSQAGYSFLEMVCVYGYSLAIYIPISILWVIPYTGLQWFLVMLGMVLSGGVLAIVFWPAVKNDDRKVAILTMGLIILFHGLLAVGFVLYFFHVSDVQHSGTISGSNSTTIASVITSEVPSTVKTMLVTKQS